MDNMDHNKKNSNNFLLEDDNDDVVCASLDDGVHGDYGALNDHVPLAVYEKDHDALKIR